MSAPSGYTALDFVGFTDKGTYNSSSTYMRNDLVHYGGNIMRCLIDNTSNVTPVVGANWELWVGASANLAERTIAPLENNPADVAYGVGRQIIYDDWLWEVIAPIAVGDALVDYAVDPTNANIKKSAPVETQLLAVKAEADATDNMIAPTEADASSSSAAYAVGDQLILNNVLYTVTDAITIGDALVSGTGGNIEASDSLTDQLASKADDSALATVAKTGAYSDLSGNPTLGTAAAKNSTNAVTQNSTDLVESGAVYSEVNTVKQALSTIKGELTNISRTGSTNTGTTISRGFYFYLDGVMKRAKETIANGASFTSSNCETVPEGCLNEFTNKTITNGNVTAGHIYAVLIEENTIKNTMFEIIYNPNDNNGVQGFGICLSNGTNLFLCSGVISLSNGTLSLSNCVRNSGNGSFAVDSWSANIRMIRQIA